MGGLSLVLLLNLLSGPQAATQADSRIRTNDAEVIEAALMSFFKKQTWQAPDWQEGDFVVVHPTYGDRKRASFTSELETVMDLCKGQPKIVARLKRIQSQTVGPPPPSEDILPLSMLELDNRIVLSKEYKSMIHRHAHVKNRLGKPGGIRVSGQLFPPSYSSDGHYAILRYLGVGWSIHCADVYFVLRKANGKWTVAEVEPLFDL